MQLEPLSQSEQQGVEGGYTNNSPFSTHNKVFDGILIGAGCGAGCGGGVGAVIGGLIGGLLGWLF